MKSKRINRSLGYISRVDRFKIKPIHILYLVAPSGKANEHKKIWSNRVNAPEHKDANRQ